MVEKIDYIAEAITDSLGERCPEHADGCPTCEAWAQYDALTTCAMIREASENERLRAALERQGDNMAFVINHATLPEQWMTKFMAELAEDRAALERQ